MIALPPELLPVLIFLLTAGIKDALKLFNMNIDGKITAFVATLVTAAITFLDAALAALPEDWRPAVTAVLSIAATLVSAFGLNRTLKALRY